MSTATKSAKAAATRDQILDAATRLIHLKGYHATALDDVLRESGVGKGNFYYYFKSKEELGYAILDRYARGFVDRVLDPLLADPAGDPVEQIRAFLDRILDGQRQRNCVGGCAMGNLASELSDVHEGFRHRLADVFDLWCRKLAEVLDRARRQGDLLPVCEPAGVARFIVASLEGAILLTKLTKDIGVMEQCVEQLKVHLGLYTSDVSSAPGHERTAAEAGGRVA